MIRRDEPSRRPLRKFGKYNTRERERERAVTVIKIHVSSKHNQNDYTYLYIKLLINTDHILSLIGGPVAKLPFVSQRGLASQEVTELQLSLSRLTIPGVSKLRRWKRRNPLGDSCWLVGWLVGCLIGWVGDYERSRHLKIYIFLQCHDVVHFFFRFQWWSKIIMIHIDSLCIILNPGVQIRWHIFHILVHYSSVLNY